MTEKLTRAEVRANAARKLDEAFLEDAKTYLDVVTSDETKALVERLQALHDPSVVEKPGQDLDLNGEIRRVLIALEGAPERAQRYVEALELRVNPPEPIAPMPVQEVGGPGLDVGGTADNSTPVVEAAQVPDA